MQAPHTSGMERLSEESSDVGQGAPGGGPVMVKRGARTEGARR